MSSATPSKLHIFNSTNKNILFNLATEEWLMDSMELEGPAMFLWQNDKTIVIGKHQNPWKECHLQAMEEDGVTLARRRSGGGAVYQDLGNSCFTFLAPKKYFNIDDNNKVLLGALDSLGIEAELKGRNDIVVGSRKISGSAFKHSKDRSLHHGTMLLHLDLMGLDRYLTPDKLKLEAKGVMSVVSRVLNLREIAPELNHGTLCDALIKQFQSHYGLSTDVVDLKEEDLEKNPKLQKSFNELSDWNWRFGNTPNFSHNMKTRFDWGLVDMHLDVKHGKVTDAVLYSDSLFPEFIEEAMTRLQGIPYDPASIRAAFEAASAAVEPTHPAVAPYGSDLGKWVEEQLRGQ